MFCRVTVSDQKLIPKSAQRFSKRNDFCFEISSMKCKILASPHHCVSFLLQDRYVTWCHFADTGLGMKMEGSAI